MSQSYLKRKIEEKFSYIAHVVFKYLTYVERGVIYYLTID